MAGIRHTTPADGSFTTAGASAWNGEEAHTLSGIAEQSAVDVVSAALALLSAAHVSLADRVSANSGTGGSGSVTSNELSAAAALLSARVDSAATALNTVSNAASIVSVAAANALSKADAASNAASIVSAAAANALSKANAASNAASVVSVAAADALSKANAVSQGLSALSNQNSADHASIRALVNTVSNAASIVSVAAADALSKANAVSNAVSVGDAGLSARLDSLVNRVSGNSGVAGAGSVTSNELSAAAATLSVRIDSLVNRVSANSGTGGAGSVTSNELSAAAALLSARVDSAVAGVNTVSVAAADALSKANAVSNAASIVSVAAADALSKANAVSQGLSALSNQNSADHASIRTLINTVSNAASIVSVAAADALSKANAVSQGLSALSNQNSADHASIRTLINTVSNATSVVSVAAADALSKANAVSNAVSVGDAALSIRIDTVSNAASNATSIANAVSTALSAYKVAPKTWPLMGLGGYQFDGSTDYLDGATFTGVADGKTGTMVVVLRFANAASATERILLSTGSQFGILRLSTGHLQVFGENSAGTLIMSMVTDTGTAPCAAAGTYVIMASWDLANSGSGRIYVNDVSSMTTATTYTNDTIDYTAAEYSIGASITGTDKFAGDLYTLWLDPTAWMELNTESNRRKFADRNNVPVFLGASGELPTGASPGLFLGYNDYTSWTTNRGTFTVTWTENGTPGAVGTSAQGQYGPLTTGGAGSVTSNELSIAAATLSTRIDSLANRVSANSGTGGAASVTSNELSIAVAALSVRIDSAFAGASNNASVASNAASVASNAASVASNAASIASAAAVVAQNAASIASAAAAGVPNHRIFIVSTDQSITASTLAKVSGLMVSLSAGETLQIEGMMLVSASAGGVGLKAGVSTNVLSLPRYIEFWRISTGQSAGGMGGAGILQVSGTSQYLSAAALGGTNVGVNFRAILNVASAGTFRIMAAGIASTVANPIHIRAGSYMIVRKLK